MLNKCCFCNFILLQLKLGKYICTCPDMCIPKYSNKTIAQNISHYEIPIFETHLKLSQKLTPKSLGIQERKNPPMMVYRVHSTLILDLAEPWIEFAFTVIHILQFIIIWQYVHYMSCTLVGVCL